MKAFLLRAAVFLVLVAALYAGMAVYLEAQFPTNHSESYQYLRSIAAKQQRAKEFSTPILLFAGGSNLPYSLNSPTIENNFHLPVVNMGVASGLGLPWILDELKHVADSGDMVVLAPEYYQTASYGMQRLVPKAAPNAMHFHRVNYVKEASVHLARTRTKLLQLLSAPGALASAVDTLEVQDTTTVFTQQGDIFYNVNKPRCYHTPIGGPRWRPPTQCNSIELLNDFAAYAAQNHIHVFYMYPVYAQQMYEKSKEVLNNYHAQDKALLDIEIIGTPTDFLYPDSCMHDSPYHLCRRASPPHTEKVIALLKNHPSAKACLQEIAAVYANNGTRKDTSWAPMVSLIKPA